MSETDHVKTIREALEDYLSYVPDHGKWPGQQALSALSALQEERERTRQSKTLIYLATPYSHPDPSVMQRRFERACEVAGGLMAAGQMVFSPIAHTHPIAVRCELPRGWDFWRNYDFAMLSAAGKVVVVQMDGWQDSKGIAGEIAIAAELGIPVEYLAYRAAMEPAPQKSLAESLCGPLCPVCRMPRMNCDCEADTFATNYRTGERDAADGTETRENTGPDARAEAGKAPNRDAKTDVEATQKGGVIAPQEGRS